MNSKRVFFVMLATLFILSGAAVTCIFFGNRMFEKQSVELVNLKLENYLIDEQQEALIEANKEIERYAELDKIARSIVPQDKDQAKTVRELNRIAEENGIKLASIEFPVSNLGQAVPKAAAPAAGEEGAPKPASPTVPPLSQVKAVEGINGVYSLDITISPLAGKSVSYQDLISFLSDLENHRRTAHVQRITINPLDRGGLSFTLTLNAYVKP